MSNPSAVATATASSRLAQTVAASTAGWQADLESLFHRAKDRFPDVVWDLVNDEDDDDDDDRDKTVADQVWGHKAIVYARAPPSFQARYFTLRSSSLPYSPSGYPTQSALSFSLGIDVPAVSRSPSPFRPVSPISTTTQGGLTRLTTAINPTLFSKELEYLYTGKDFGEAFEFLFDSSEHSRDPSESRVDKLRKDLVFMWRSRLYSDVRIVIEGSHSATHEGTAAVFSTHRFMLVTRSAYFHNALIAWPSAKPPRAPAPAASGDGDDDDDDASDDQPAEPPTLTLPSPPFTPPALHFILGFIYTGTLIFSNRTYDLDTAFHILRSSTYLSLDTLHAEIEARIVHDMLHGLFNAFLEFAEYEAATGGKWGGGGCRCRQCARRVPRVLEFALLEDVKNATLERGARRALVGLFGDGWCHPEFARLDRRVREQALKGVAKRTTPMNVVPLLLAANAALARLDTVIEPWADVVRDMIVDARRTVDACLANNADECFGNFEWDEIMHSDGVRFDDGDIVDQVLQSLRRGFSDKTAGALYQTIVSSILLRAAPDEPNKTMLSPTSPIRARVENARHDLILWLRKRWIGVRQEGGFDSLESWALKEISDEIGVPVEDLQSTSPSARGATNRTGVRSSVGQAPADRDDADTASMQSLRTSVLNRRMARNHVTNPSTRDSTAGSIRSVARSVTSTISSRTAPPRRAAPSRPDSKLEPSSTSLRRSRSPSPSPSTATAQSVAAAAETTKPVPSTSAPSSPRIEQPAKRPRAAADIPVRPKSSASSIASVRSKASTVRTTRNVSAGQSTPAQRTPSRTGANTISTATRSSTLHPDDATRARRTSAASTISTTSVKTTASVSKPVLRPRPPSAASMRSTPSTTVPVRSRKPPVPSPDPAKTTTAATTHRTISTSSVKSTASSISLAAKKSTVRKTTPAAESNKTTAGMASSTLKGKGKAGAGAAAGSPSTGAMHKTVPRKGSADTITRGSASTVRTRAQQQQQQQQEYYARGARLEIGIPCIITSRRARFRAYARYIGEVEGEAGPWVGVEVPMADAWPGEKIDGRPWHDGTWGGVRYFDLVGETEWGEVSESMHASSRRRLEYKSTLSKRDGEQFASKRYRSVSPAVSDATNGGAETRGLFVRPQQVLYVVDAVGADL